MNGNVFLMRVAGQIYEKSQESDPPDPQTQVPRFFDRGWFGQTDRSPYAVIVSLSPRAGPVVDIDWRLSTFERTRATRLMNFWSARGH